MAEKNDKPNRT